MKGLRATRGSRAFADFICPEDAVAVRRLRAAGAAIVGRTTNPELCFRGVTQSVLHGVTRNPFDLTRVAGGSSGGSGAAVAAGAVPMALGTDGGGSIRIPASFCGVVGHKPTFGLVPVTPGFRGWETLSVVGPIARTVAEARFLLDVIAGPDPSDPGSLNVPRLPLPRATARDPAPYPPARAAGDPRRRPGEPAAAPATCAPPPRRPARRRPRRPARRRQRRPRAPAGRAGGARGVLRRGGRAARRRVGDRRRRAGADPQRPDLGRDRRARGLRRRSALLERPELLEADTARLLAAGADVSAAQYLDALEERARYIRAWAAFFTGFDVLLTPTMQMTAFPVGHADAGGDRRRAGRPVLRRLVQLLPAREPDGLPGHVGAVRLRRGRPADRAAGHGPARRRRLDARRRRGLGIPVRLAPARPRPPG